MQDHLAFFVNALLGLDATQSKGFEGLLRDLLMELTGHRFRLLKPGPQGGIDVLQEQHANGLIIGLEGKRYGATTTLPLDDLKYKLFDAAQSYPALDLWLLATTREISATDQQALYQLGEELGVAVVVLDWSAAPGPLPSLAVLCAAAPGIVKSHLGDTLEIEACLNWVQQHERYEAERRRLINQLTSSDVGYTAAQASIATWLRHSFADQRTAKANLDSSAHLLDPSVKRVSRPTITAALDGWWNCYRQYPLVVLGEEGMGKTWAALSWWLDRITSDDQELPLTLVIPARDVGGKNPEALIAETLARHTQLRTVEFWRRRLRLWRQDRTILPKILLIIDGLNQNWMFRGWADLLQPLFADEWQDQVAVILTCRPDHWRTQLQNLSNLEPSPYPVSVSRFNDEELDALLSLYDCYRRDFSPALLNLMRVPRLCQLAIEQRNVNVLQESGDITHERLIYEDWKQRLAIHGEDLAVSDIEFRDWVAELGQKLRDDLEQGSGKTITRRDLIERLGRDSGVDSKDLATTISEIVDGRWLVECAGRPHQFHLSPALAPYALGLALVDNLRSVKDELAILDRLAVFFDPLRGQDFGVDILRVASTVAILEPDCSPVIRLCLIEAWFAEQNFRAEDFEAFWRLVAADPELFLKLAERVWLRRGGGIHGDEVLIKTLTNAYKWPQVAQRLQDRAVEWLAVFWPDPDQGLYLNYDPHTEEAAGHREATADRYQQWEMIAPQLGIQFPLRCVENGDPSWFAHRVVGVLSFLPRQPFVSALLAWAISRAIMGTPRHFDEIAWLLRWNPYDPAEVSSTLLAEVDRLQSLDHPITAEGTRWLLEALGTPEAMARQDSQTQTEEPPGRWPDTVHVDQVTGIIQWDHAEALQWPRSQEVPLDATLGLAKFALNPNLTLPNDSINRLCHLAGDTNAGALWKHGRMATAEDHSLETATEPLARWAPGALGDLMRRVYASASERNQEALWGLALHLPGHIFHLDNGQLHGLIEVANLLANKQHAETAEDSFWSSRFLIARLWNRPAAEQINVLANQPGILYLEEKHRSILAPPTDDDFESLSQYLAPDTPCDQLRGWLYYLSLVSLDRMPTGYAPLISLIQHADEIVRRLVLEIVYWSSDQELAWAVEQNGWRYRGEMDRKEAAYGSLALCNVTTDENAASIRARIDPQALGHLTIKRGCRSSDLDAFAGFVEDQISAILHGSVPQTRSLYWADNDKALDLLVQQRGKEVIAWMEPLLEDRSDSRRGAFMESFPLVNLTRALLQNWPVEGAKLWTTLLKVYDRDIFRLEEFELLPIEAVDHPEILKLRRQVLDRARTDLDLIKIAGKVIKYDGQSWLIDCIEQDLKGGSAGLIARAMTLAGFLDASGEAKALWSGPLASPAASGWLTHVHGWANSLFQRNCWAHHWLNAFVAERNRDRAFAHHALFLACTDRRTLIWAPQRINDVYNALPQPWLCHWSLRWPDVRNSIKKGDDQYKKTLYGTKIFEHTQAPWLSRP